MSRSWPLSVVARIYVVMIASSLGFACSPRYYVPNTHNVPLLREKTDAMVTGAIGDGRFEALGAFAFTDHIGGLFNASFFRPEDDPDGDGGSGDFGEIGVGYFTPIAPLQFEVFGLFGLGELENHFPSSTIVNPGTTGILEGRVTRFGVQTILGAQLKYFEAAFSIRLTSLKYRNISGDLIFNGEDQAAFLRLNDRYTMLEPALTVRAGAEFVKLQLQLGGTANLTDSNLRQDEGHLTVGVVYFPTRQFRPREER